jgi:hypothetical protein
MRYGEEPANAAEKKGQIKMVLKPTTKATLEPESSAPGTTNPPQRAPVAWDSNGAKTLRSSFANLRNPSQAPHGAPTGPRAGRTKSTLNMMNNFQDPSAVAANLGHMKIKDDTQSQGWNPNSEKYYDPSAGPTGSTATAQ